LAHFSHIFIRCQETAQLEGKKMQKEQMLKRISELESLNDQMLTELRYLDALLIEVGFEEGIKTMKVAANELLQEGKTLEEDS